MSVAFRHPSSPPETLHPSLWRAWQLARGRESVTPTGFTALDDELPGGGWPHRTLTELLLSHPGVGEMRLMAPALSAQARAGRTVMWFDPPAVPCAQALEALGVEAHRLVMVHGRQGLRGAQRRHLLASADVLWALEQALRSGHVGLVVAWLPEGLRADALRRLQLAAQAHDGPVFLLRAMASRLKPSAASLRLALSPAGGDALSLHVFKRRGPARTQPLVLALPVVVPFPRPAAAVVDPGEPPGPVPALRTPMAA
jgi:protein ImuA